VYYFSSSPQAEGFNYGSLFLLPKDDSLLIDHTRPISVANADNRIIAKLLANILGPELNKILHASQKGFIPGRCGLDHTHDLTASFYGAAERGDQRYVLFLDTKKAFDSSPPVSTSSRAAAHQM
jgi:hypothetical protein